MRLLAFSNRSLSSTGVNLRKLFTRIKSEKRNLSDIVQGSLAPFIEIQRPLYYFWAPARFFSHTESDKILDLPRSCPGCGAFTQITNPDQAGFYEITRKGVEAFIAWSRGVQRELEGEEFGSSLGPMHCYIPRKSNMQQG